MNDEKLKITKEERISFYKKMLEIRRFEEKVEELYSEGLIPGLAHTYNGQEGVAVGVCSALNESDYVLSTHRGHGHSIAKGVPSKLIMAELFGKETGVCKGIGGSMHSTHIESGVLFSTAIVGGNIPITTGVGLGIKLKKEKKVAVSFFGDGATNTGAFHEAVTNEILSDLVKACNPRFMRLTAEFNVRGGVYTNVVAEHKDPAWTAPSVVTLP